MNEFYSIHNHSRYSVNDALPMVEHMAVEAQRRDYRALGLTDHGAVAGNLALYKACRKIGIEPMPGIELYVTADREAKVQGHNMHLTVVSYSSQGYLNLCRLVTMTARNFYYKPRVDLADFAAMAEAGTTQGLAIATGCWFGLLPTTLRLRGHDHALALLKTLAGWFPRVYIELQAHGIEQIPTPEALTNAAIMENVQASTKKAWNILLPDKPSELADYFEARDVVIDWKNVEARYDRLAWEGRHSEEELVAELIELSAEAGIPYIITTDSHYIEAADQPIHNGLKRLCSWSDDVDDAIFPGGPYSFMSAVDLRRYFEPDVVTSACDTLADLADRASVRIPSIENFKMLMPEVAKTADADSELRELVLAGLDTFVGDEPAATRARRLKRVDEELEVIFAAGFTEYILLIAGICGFMNREEIVFNPRGSANNSEVNYLAGITNVSAFEDDLRFERFISIDRIKPPDIDLDIEHERRAEVLEYANLNFTTCHVGTLPEYKTEENEEEYEDEEAKGQGSLWVRYYATIKKRGETGRPRSQVAMSDRALLKELGSRKLVSGYGTNAAGIILAPDAATIADLPMVRIGKGKGAHLGTAYGKDDVEDLGFIKVDMLGLRTLTAVAIATRLVMKDKRYEGDPHQTPMEFLRSIPLNDGKVYTRIGSRKTAGIFQIGQGPATDLCAKMKPRNLREVIAAMALMRPAAKASGAQFTYLARRKGMEKVPVMHADIMAETKKTFGTIIFQEQVIGMCRTLGMDMPELNKILKAVKASNSYIGDAREVLAAAMPRIQALALDRDWDEADITLLMDAVAGYGDYGFNEGHADGYGRLAYHTGWLAENWAPHWWTGLLYAYAGEKEEPRYAGAARKLGVRILPADVNHSQRSYSYEAEHDSVRRGLLSIKGVGPVAAAEIAAKAPYTTLTDFAQRVLPSKVSGAKALILGEKLNEVGGVVGALNEYGALDCLVE